MITVNTYAVTERAVYTGVAEALAKILPGGSGAGTADKLVEEIVSAVMQELCATLDFGIQPIRFTTDLVRKLILAAPQTEEPNKQQQNDLPGEEA